MSNLLRGLAFVCLILGFVSAARAGSDGRYAVQAVVWFLLEFVLLWLNSPTGWLAKRSAQESQVIAGFSNDDLAMDGVSPRAIESSAAESESCSDATTH